MFSIFLFQKCSHHRQVIFALTANSTGALGSNCGTNVIVVAFDNRGLGSNPVIASYVEQKDKAVGDGRFTPQKFIPMSRFLCWQFVKLVQIE